MVRLKQLCVSLKADPGSQQLALCREPGWKRSIGPPGGQACFATPFRATHQHPVGINRF